MLIAFPKLGLLFLLILSFSHLSMANTAAVKKLGSTFDFTHWQVEDGAVSLNGDWGMFWQEQLLPQDMPKQPSLMIDMPMTWDRSALTSPSLPGIGFATFTATLKNLPDDIRWGMTIPEQSTSFRLYVNNRIVAEGGIAGVSKDSSKPYSGNQLIELGLLPSNTQLIWNVSNFHNASGGPWQSLKVGPYSELRNKYTLQTFDQALVVVLSIITGLLLIIQHFIDKRDHASLVLSVFAFLVALRIGITDNQPLYQIAGALNWQLHIRCVYLTMLIPPLLLLLWQHYIFPMELSRRSIRYVSYIFILPILSIIVLPAEIFTQFLSVFQILVLGIIVLYSVSLLKVLFRRRPGGFYLVFGTSILIVTSFHDLAAYSQMLESTRAWLSYGVLVFLLSLAIHIVVLRAQQRQKVGDLSKQLLIANKKLEARVAQRTFELAEKANALEEANDKLQVLANIDGLTGVLNRRAFVEQLNMLSRVQSRIALLMIDVDHFKAVNDNFGHAIGDQVLIRLSKTLLTLKRENDRVGRFGGEEFVVLLQDISEEGLDSYCHRLIDAVRNIDFTDIAPLDGITISMGTAMATLSAQNIDELIKQADEAMYFVKNNGRNGFKHYQNNNA